jgi:hypothetical protein
MRTTAFVLGGIAGAVAMSMWSRGRQSNSNGTSSSHVPSTIKSIINRNPDVKQAVDEIAQENHLPHL